MPRPLARLAATADHAELEVFEAITAQDLDDLYRLRYRVYVEEMGIVAEDHPFVRDGRLVDPYDATSTNLLLRVGGEAAGSLRITEARRGALEIDEYTDASGFCPDASQALEITRLMVRRDLRGSRASALLFLAMWRLLQRRGRYLLAAAKPGGLGRYYKHLCRLGFELHPETFCYGLTGCRYELICVDLGARWSLRRLAWRAWALALQAVALHGPRQGLAWARRDRPRAVPAGEPAMA